MAVRVHFTADEVLAMGCDDGVFLVRKLANPGNANLRDNLIARLRGDARHRGLAPGTKFLFTFAHNETLFQFAQWTGEALVEWPVLALDPAALDPAAANAA